MQSQEEKLEKGLIAEVSRLIGLLNHSEK